MSETTLFPAAIRGTDGGAQASCIARLVAAGDGRVLTVEALSRRDLAELLAASRDGPVEVRFRIPTPDRRLAAALEPGLPPPSLRLASLRVARRAGLAAGILVAPLIPGVNDMECDVARLFDEARRARAAFVEFGLASSTEAGGRRLVRSLRERYPRAAARLHVRRLTTDPAPGEDRARVEAMVRRLAAAFDVPVRGVFVPVPGGGRPGGGQQRFSFAV